MKLQVNIRNKKEGQEKMKSNKFSELFNYLKVLQHLLSLQSIVK